MSVSSPLVSPHPPLLVTQLLSPPVESESHDLRLVFRGQGGGDLLSCHQPGHHYLFPLDVSSPDHSPKYFPQSRDGFFCPRNPIILLYSFFPIENIWPVQSAPQPKSFFAQLPSIHISPSFFASGNLCHLSIVRLLSCHFQIFSGEMRAGILQLFSLPYPQSFWKSMRLHPYSLGRSPLVLNSRKFIPSCPAKVLRVRVRLPRRTTGVHPSLHPLLSLIGNSQCIWLSLDFIDILYLISYSHSQE